MHASESTGPIEGESPASRRTALGAVLALTGLASFASGVFWNAIGFVAKHAYDFPQWRTLLLLGATAIVYAVGAATSGRLLRRLERRLSPRGAVGLLLAAQAAACLLPPLLDAEAFLWTATMIVGWSSSVLWPAVESFVVSGRHGLAMRRAVGWFNITWMSAIAIPLLAMGPFLEHHARWTVGAVAIAMLLAIVPLLRFAPHPEHHDPEEVVRHVPGSYPALLRSTRVLLPLGYVLMSAFSPVVPYRFETMDVPVALETATTATWMIARVVAAVLLWRIAFWHGRWSTLLVAALAMALGFALVVLAPTPAPMIVGFVLFGLGQGAIYYAALYYGMAVGRAGIDAGGTHEALIGCGYAIGPAAALAGSAMAGPPGIVATTLALVGLGGVLAVAPWRAARRGAG